MGRNRIKLIPLLLVTPMLFMGNSVSQGVWSETYGDYEITEITFGEMESSKYPFTITIENKGDGYIDIGNRFEIDTKDDYFMFEDEAFIYDNGFSILLAPHSTATYKSITATYEKFDLEDVNVYCNAYVLPKEGMNFEYEYTGFKYDSLEKRDDGAVYIYKALDFFIEDVERYYYSKIVDVTIKGIKYSFIDNNSSDEFIRIPLADDTLTEEDIVIDNLQIIRGAASSLKYTEDLIVAALKCLGAIAIGVVVLFVIGVFPIFILPPIIRKAKRRKEAN